MRSAAFLARPSGAISRLTLRAVAPTLVLAAAMASLLFSVPPLGAFPVEDDWGYVRMVQHLVDDGRVQIHAWNTTSVVLQLFWGALFARLFGFSFDVLRASTLVFAGAGIVGCYTLLRALLDERRALLGALLLLANPLYVFQAYSFLTDVPFLALAIWALVFYSRALRTPRPALRWLAAGSCIAAGAFLIRQIGFLLPISAVVCLLLRQPARAALRPAHLLAIFGPIAPAMLLNAYLDTLRGPVRTDFFGWTLGYWADNYSLFLAVVVSRLAGVFTTLGLFMLPVCLAWLACRPTLRLGPRQIVAVLAGLLLTLTGVVVRVVDFGENLLFPHLTKFFSAHGFGAHRIGDTLPEAISIPNSVTIAITLASILGFALLALLAATSISHNHVRGPAAAPLVFGLIALGLTVSNRGIPLADRYLLPLLPPVLLIGLLAVKPTARSTVILAAGVMLLAGWSIWWEREYLQRRSALWQAGQALVERGIPPEEVDGGFEWNGWYRSESVIPAAAQRAFQEGQPRLLDTYAVEGIMRRSRWTMAFVPPDEAARSNKVLVIVPYWRGQVVVGWQRS